VRLLAGQLGDLYLAAADHDLDVQLAVDGLHMALECIDLRSFNIAVLEAGHSVLANVERHREFNLSNSKRCTQLAKLLRLHFVKHVPCVLVDGRGGST
jgi:hypothetical protein